MMIVPERLYHVRCYKSDDFLLPLVYQISWASWPRSRFRKAQQLVLDLRNINVLPTTLLLECETSRQRAWNRQDMPRLYQIRNDGDENTLNC
jgi:hypothetical protein